MTGKDRWLLFGAVSFLIFSALFFFHLRWIEPHLRSVEMRKEALAQNEALLRKLQQKVRRLRQVLPELKRRRAELQEELQGWEPVEDPYQLISLLKGRLKPYMGEDLQLENYRVEEGEGGRKIVLSLYSNIRGLSELLKEIEEMKGLYITAISIKKMRRLKGGLDLSVRLRCESIGG